MSWLQSHGQWWPLPQWEACIMLWYAWMQHTHSSSKSRLQPAEAKVVRNSSPPETDLDALRSYHIPVLLDGLDQLPLREMLFTVILTLIIRVEVCNKA